MTMASNEQWKPPNWDFATGQQYPPPGPDFTQYNDRETWTGAQESPSYGTAQPDYWAQQQAARPEKRKDPVIAAMVRALKVIALGTAILFLVLLAISFIAGMVSAMVGA